jgi:hypothetical protein
MHPVQSQAAPVLSGVPQKSCQSAPVLPGKRVKLYVEHLRAQMEDVLGSVHPWQLGN